MDDPIKEQGIKVWEIELASPAPVMTETGRFGSFGRRSRRGGKQSRRLRVFFNTDGTVREIMFHGRRLMGFDYADYVRNRPTALLYNPLEFVLPRASFEEVRALVACDDPVVAFIGLIELVEYRFNTPVFRLALHEIKLAEAKPWSPTEFLGADQFFALTQEYDEQGVGEHDDDE